jgi:hypothetical protein
MKSPLSTNLALEWLLRLGILPSDRQPESHLCPRLFLLKQQVSLEKAIEILELAFDGMPHTALADPRNTARVHAALIRRMRA